MFSHKTEDFLPENDVVTGSESRLNAAGDLASIYPDKHGIL